MAPSFTITDRAYELLVTELLCQGYLSEITWSENVQPPERPRQLAREAIYVICNSGMRFQVARNIYDKVLDCIIMDQPVLSAFKHKGKAAAIEKIWAERHTLFKAYQAADDKIAFLETLPWIGPITKYHLAKNLGFDVVKPDRHLVRIAEACGETPDELCERLTADFAHKKRTVDLVLWRAANIGLINTQTMRWHPELEARFEEKACA